MTPATKTYSFTLFIQGADVLNVDQKTRLWHWPDVAHWLTEHDQAKLDVDPEAVDLVAALNAAYDLREHTRRLPTAALARAQRLVDERAQSGSLK